MNTNEGNEEDVVVDDSKVLPLSLNFGEIMLIEGSIKNYEEELVGDMVAAIPVNRPAYFVKDIILKIGSAYVEMFDHRSDLEFYMDVNFTEKELWVLRQVVQPAMSFNKVVFPLPDGPKIQEILSLLRLKLILFKIFLLLIE